MSENQSADLLEEVYKATQMGLEATRLVTPKIQDEGLRKEVRRQESCYQKIVTEAEDLLSSRGKHPEANETMKKAMLWGSVQLNTLMDSSTEHIAEMMINGTTMGIVDMTKKLNDLGNADSEARKLAKEFIGNEEKHIEELKKHL